MFLKRAGWVAVLFFSGFSIGLAEVTIRARVTAVEPEAYVRLFWTWGGQGLGGDPVNGEWTAVKPGKPTAAAHPQLGAPDNSEADPLLDVLKKPEGLSDVMVEEGSTFDYQWLRKGVWSPEIPLSAFHTAGLRFLTVYAEGCKPGKAKARVNLKSAVFEFELFENGKTLKTFQEASPAGAVGTIIVPMKLLENGKAGPAFLAQAQGLSSLIASRLAFMKGLPWAGDALPKLYEIETDCGGYGTGHGYAVRTSSQAVLFDEFQILRQMGVNGLRNNPSFFPEMVKARRPEVMGLSRVHEGHVGGYPFERAPADHITGKLRPLPWEPGWGCPYHPVWSNRAAEAEAALESELKIGREMPYTTWWCLTVDEIGSAFDATAERKEHQGVCPHCTEAFRTFLKSKGLGPKDFDAADWTPIRSTYGYFSKPYEQRMREEAEAAAKAAPKLGDTSMDWKRTSKPDAAEMVGMTPAAPAAKTAEKAATVDETVVDLSDEQVEKGGAKGLEKALAAEAAKQGIPPSPTPALSARGWHKLSYWSRQFNCIGSAQLFSPMRAAFLAANERKRKALEQGRFDSPEAKQPWIYMYALRGNSFLLGGHSLDFFDFYRYSDNGFMYETSNRDPRVWQWDSYLCDVGRILHEKMGLAFGVYVKPHRGAGMQRALSAIARGVRCLYWYTYGPDWAKGDTFGGNTNVMADVSRCARLIGEAEPVTWEGVWMKPAEIAVVRPRTAEFFGNNAQWEDGKWVYAALTHAHLSLDPLDEEFLLSEDLSRYKAIYITGSHIRRDVVPSVVRYVNNGGTLFTSCGGLIRDEAGQIIEELLPVFGLKGRADPVVWGNVPRYGATALGKISPLTNAPADAVVHPGGAAGAGPGFPLQVGYEKLRPAEGTKVHAVFADGSPALVQHAYGKGQAWMAGYYAGVEYAAGVMKDGYDMSAEFPAALRKLIVQPALNAGVKAVVETSQPLVESVGIRNPKSGRQAVVLMNWAYKGKEQVRFTDVTVTIRDAGALKGARSVWQRKALPVEKQGNSLIINVGELEDGDVLLMD
jgi:hypothetical protein